MAHHSEYPCLIRGPRGTALFVHIPRTGGQSLCRVFNINDEHYTASTHRCKLGPSAWHGAYRFCVVRNPWDHYVSYYMHSHGMQKLEDPQVDIDGFRRWVQQGCQRRYGTWGNPEPVDPLNQLAFIRTAGKTELDTLFMFPHLQQIVDAVVLKTGVPERTLPHIGKMSRGPYRDFYTDAERDIVAGQRSEEIKEFGFRF